MRWLLAVVEVPDRAITLLNKQAAEYQDVARIGACGSQWHSGKRWGTPNPVCVRAAGRSVHRRTHHQGTLKRSSEWAETSPKASSSTVSTKCYKNYLTSCAGRTFGRTHVRAGLVYGAQPAAGAEVLDDSYYEEILRWWRKLAVVNSHTELSSDLQGAAKKKEKAWRRKRKRRPWEGFTLVGQSKKRSAVN